MRLTFLSEYVNASFTLLVHSALVRDRSRKSAAWQVHIATESPGDCPRRSKSACTLNTGTDFSGTTTALRNVSMYGIVGKSPTRSGRVCWNPDAQVPRCGPSMTSRTRVASCSTALN